MVKKRIVLECSVTIGLVGEENYCIGLVGGGLGWPIVIIVKAIQYKVD
jgi:hypothetical protein